MGNTYFAVLVLGVSIGAWFYMKQPKDRDILSEKIAEEYDYVIVGGGSAGSVLAARLSEDKGNKVLLLEAGGFYDENPVFHIPFAWLLMLNTTNDWGYLTSPQTHSSQGMNNKQVYFPRGRVLGGSSVLNAMQYTRGSPFDFDEWAANGCTGWSYKDVLPYFIKSEDVLIPELQNSKYHGTGGPLAVSGGKITPLSEMYLKAGEEMGYPTTDYNSADISGFSDVQLTVRNGVRSSTGVEYLGKMAKKDNLDISINSFVTKIDISNKVANGVFYIKNGKKQFVKARKEVIVSAGAINSPQLLMLSGIGPKQHLSDLGIPVVIDLPVGQNLQDHQLVILQAKINEPISMTLDCVQNWWNTLKYLVFGTGPQSGTGTETNAFIHKDEKLIGKAKPDIQLCIISYNLEFNFLNLNDNMFKQYMKSSNLNGFGMAAVLSHPKSKGAIELNSADPFDYPNIDPRYFTEKEDIDTLTTGIRFWEEYLNTKTMQSIGANDDAMRFEVCSQHEFRSGSYWECFIRHFATTTWHQSGTCKMGAKDDPTAVVDSELRVRGIKGLRVVDASIFPIMTSGNTNAPVIMVAERAADLIRQKDTVEHIRDKIKDVL